MIQYGNCSNHCHDYKNILNPSYFINNLLKTICTVINMLEWCVFQRYLGIYILSIKIKQLFGPNPCPNKVFTLPRLIHMESMESIRYSMWNDYGMVNSIWNSTLFHMDSTGFHGTSPYGFCWNSIWKIPWYLLSKIVSSMRIEHLTPQHITCMNERTL